MLLQSICSTQDSFLLSKQVDLSTQIDSKGGRSIKRTIKTISKKKPQKNQSEKTHIKLSQASRCSSKDMLRFSTPPHMKYDLNLECVRKENHIFNGYIVLQVKYIQELGSFIQTKQVGHSNSLKEINSPIPSISDTRNGQHKNINQCNKRNENDQEYQLISAIVNEWESDISLPFIFKQRESIQNEQLTHFINTYLKDTDFFSFTVMKADLSVRNVSLSQVGFSQKLMNVLNFDSSSTSLSGCQQLISNCMLSTPSFDKVQTMMDRLAETRNELTSNDMFLPSFKLRTGDGFELMCSCNVSLFKFSYPLHILQQFGPLNERVYFIRYSIERTNIVQLYNSRNFTHFHCTQHTNMDQINKINEPQNYHHQKSYKESSRYFVDKYYASEYQTQMDLQQIKQLESQENADMQSYQTSSSKDIKIDHPNIFIHSQSSKKYFQSQSNINNDSNSQQKLSDLQEVCDLEENVDSEDSNSDDMSLLLYKLTFAKQQQQEKEQQQQLLIQKIQKDEQQQQYEDNQMRENQNKSFLESQLLSYNSESYNEIDSNLYNVIHNELQDNAENSMFAFEFKDSEPEKYIHTLSFNSYIDLFS